MNKIKKGQLAGLDTPTLPFLHRARNRKWDCRKASSTRVKTRVFQNNRKGRSGLRGQKGRKGPRDKSWKRAQRKGKGGAAGEGGDILPVSVKSASSSNSSEAGPGCGAFSSASLTSSSLTIIAFRCSKAKIGPKRLETVRMLRFKEA